MKKIIIPLILIISLIAGVSVEAKNIVKFGNDITIEKDQKADYVIGIGGQITINGLVEGNVVAIGDSIVLTGNAVVRGNVVCLGGVIVKGSGAQVFGDITEINSSNISTAINSAINNEWEGWSWIFAIISVCFFLAIFVFALLLVLLIPRPVIIVSAVIHDRKGKSLIWGFLGILLVAPLAVLLALSIIGIPLIPLEFTLVILALTVGFIAAGSLFGKFVLLNILKRSEPGLVKATLFGLLLLWLIGWIPYIGWVIKTIVAVSGLGGVLLALFDRKKQLAPPPAAEAPAVTTTEQKL
jgi:MFS family permease